MKSMPMRSLLARLAFLFVLACATACAGTESGNPSQGRFDAGGGAGGTSGSGGGGGSAAGAGGASGVGGTGGGGTGGGDNDGGSDDDAGSD